MINSSLHGMQEKDEILSIIIPCFNEAEVIVETITRLTRFCDELTNLNVELIFVDDGSHDNTRELLKTYATKDSRFKIIGLARNFGHQNRGDRWNRRSPR